jgi:hypothetical protein
LSQTTLSLAFRVTALSLSGRSIQSGSEIQDHGHVANARFLKRLALGHKPQSVIKALGTLLGVQQHLCVTALSGLGHQSQ